MGSVATLDLSTQADLERWQAYIQSRDDTQFSDLGQWRPLFAELGGTPSVSLAAVEDGVTRGVASVYLIASPFFGRVLVTSPYFGTSGGLYAEDEEVRAALLEEIDRAARELRADFVELRLRQPIAEPYGVIEDFLEFELPLEGSADALWNDALSSNVRQNIRKSRSFPLEFSLATDPTPTYGMLSRTIRDLGTPFHSRRLLDLMVKHLPEHVRFSEVRLEGELVAAGLVLRFRDRLSTPFIGSLRSHRHTRANYCQYWGIIEHGYEQGLRTFDMGRSPAGSAHQSFKEKWGAQRIQAYYCHRTLSKRRTYRTVLEPSALERAASATWKRMPLFVTRRLGPLLSRYIP